MSCYMEGKLRARGKTEILRDFVKYLENDYDDGNTSELIKRGEIGGNTVTKDFINENCYELEGYGNYFFLDISSFSRLYPSLKFEYIQENSDCTDESDYRVCLNGETLDSADGNSLTFGIDDEERCRLCNCDLGYYNDVYCYDCEEFLTVIE